MPPLCDQMKRMSGQRNAVPAFAEDQAGDRPRGVGGEFDGADRNAFDHAGAAGRRGRMGVNHRLAPVELLEHRHEGRIAEIFAAVAGEQADAVGLEHVERVLDLAQAAFGIGQRNGGEQAEAAGMIAAQLRADSRCTGARACAPPSTSPNQTPGCTTRQHRRRHAGLLHVVERQLRRPFRRARRLACFAIASTCSGGR